MIGRVALIALLVAAPHAAAWADTTYATLAGNLGATGETAANVIFQPIYGSTFAQRFTTGTLPTIGDGDSSGLILYQFSWDLLAAQSGFDPTDEENPFPNLDTTYTMNLFTDANGAPGTSLLALGPTTGNLSAPGVVAFTYADLVNDPSIALQSNTSYWLTVAFQTASAAVGQPLRLPFTTGSNQTGPGTIDNLMVNTGSGWSGLSERAVVQVQVETVPEPSAIALTAAGLAILGWRRLRQTRRAVA